MMKKNRVAFFVCVVALCASCQRVAPETGSKSGPKEGPAPAVETAVASEAGVPEIRTVDDAVTYGKRLASTKGQCLTCHSLEDKSGMRGPGWGLGKDGASLGRRSAGRRGGISARDYLYESIAEPSAYIVPGFGSPGSKSLMPEFTEPPFNLTKGEILSIVAYLESLGGDKPDVSADEVKKALKESPPKAATSESDKPLTPGERAAVKRGGELYQTKAICISCHVAQIEGMKTGGSVGPDLSNIGAIQTDAYIRQSILDPNAVVVSGFPPNVMPPIFSQMLTPGELNDVVAFLNDQKAELRARNAGRDRGAILFWTKGTCIGCHRVATEGGTIGPDLSHIGSIQAADYLKEAILDPNAVIVPGYQPDIMMAVFDRILTAQEVNDLVVYLQSLQ